MDANEIMLYECLAAFESMDTAAHARKFLKNNLGIVPSAYEGKGQLLVREEMIKRLRKHLGKDA
jgi:hypothetical protein